MQELTQEGRSALDDIARRHGVSADAALTLLRAVAAGGGTMAQFNHPELGGMGQWTAGGMVMVGDMFNYGLQQRVSGLCADLAAMLRGAPVFAPQPHAGSAGGGRYPGGGGQWWPPGLGEPAASGAQNDLRYAYFPAARRLAVQQDGRVRVHDTGDHQIGGVSQQQSGTQSLAFTSQHGPVRLADLPLVEPPGPAAAGPAAAAGPIPAATAEPVHPAAAVPTPATPPAAVTQPALQPAAAPAPVHPPAPPPVHHQAPARSEPPAAHPHFATPVQVQPVAGGDPLALIERLAELHQRGILSDDEYATKKTELLRRL